VFRRRRQTKAFDSKQLAGQNIICVCRVRGRPRLSANQNPVPPTSRFAFLWIRVFEKQGPPWRTGFFCDPRQSATPNPRRPDEARLGLPWSSPPPLDWLGLLLKIKRAPKITGGNKVCPPRAGPPAQFITFGTYCPLANEPRNRNCRPNGPKARVDFIAEPRKTCVNLPPHVAPRGGFPIFPVNCPYKSTAQKRPRSSVWAGARPPAQACRCPISLGS